jgi:hypothetical protein
MKIEQRVSKRRHIKFRSRKITQKKARKIIIPAHTTYEDGTECFETSAYKIQTPGNYTKESKEI